MAQNTWKKISGVWVEIIMIWKKLSGVWEDDVVSWIKVDGVWRQSYPSPPSIQISQASFNIGWEWKSKDYFSINVTPDGMSWTVTIEDTGQGTSWVGCVPASGTGDLIDPNIYMIANEENTTGLARSANVRFSDNGSQAPDVVKVVTQEQNPT